MSEKDHGEDDGEELPGGADGGAHERVEAGDGEIDEVLAGGGRQRQAQHVALPEKRARCVCFRLLQRKRSSRPSEGGGGRMVGEIVLIDTST